ncbi:MAG: NADH-quinone oxidoreductase subunit NuoE [Pseudomonadota bacterium]
MSASVKSIKIEQPYSFVFTDDNLKQAEKIIARYPAGRQASAVMPLLTIAQKQNHNWLPKVAMDYIAEMLSMPYMRVYEVASFYTMYNLAPVGKHMVEICTTTPCWLRGSSEIVSSCEKHLGIKIGETTTDGVFTLKEAECLGACVNAPMLQIGDNYYEDLTPENVVGILEELKQGKKPKAGSQIGRVSSEPKGGATTLSNI